MVLFFDDKLSPRPAAVATAFLESTRAEDRIVGLVRGVTS